MPTDADDIEIRVGHLELVLERIDEGPLPTGVEAVEDGLQELKLVRARLVCLTQATRPVVDRATAQ